MNERVLARLAASHEQVLGELVEFASIPSVSTDPAHAADIQAAADIFRLALSTPGGSVGSGRSRRRGGSTCEGIRPRWSASSAR